MINGQYKTRKHQIRSFERQARKGKMGLAVALRSAAMVGAAEERGRTLGILSEANDLRQASRIVTAVSIMEVLGYECSIPSSWRDYEACETIECLKGQIKEVKGKTNDLKSEIEEIQRNAKE